jgi:RNA polymerase sigma-70 factor (ECF subfamily)
MFFKPLAKKSDEELMLLIQQGEERALTELYKRYSKIMIRYFYRMLWQDKNTAQDFLHDIFVKLIENPKSFNTNKKFSTWFYSVAHNMCKNEYRKQNFRNAANSDIQLVERMENRISEDIDQQEFLKVLNDALMLWEEEDRSLFIFRYELEMTFIEIGAVLNCPEGTARSRWFYLRKELAERLQEFKSILK